MGIRSVAGIRKYQRSYHKLTLADDPELLKGVFLYTFATDMSYASILTQKNQDGDTVSSGLHEDPAGGNLRVEVRANKILRASYQAPKCSKVHQV